MSVGVYATDAGIEEGVQRGCCMGGQQQGGPQVHAGREVFGQAPRAGFASRVVGPMHRMLSRDAARVLQHVLAGHVVVEEQAWPSAPGAAASSRTAAAQGSQDRRGIAMRHGVCGSLGVSLAGVRLGGTGFPGRATPVPCVPKHLPSLPRGAVRCNGCLRSWSESPK